MATHHASINHSKAEPHFYRFEIEEVLTNLKEINYPALILEGYHYSFRDNKGDGFWKDRSGAFVLPNVSLVRDFDLSSFEASLIANEIDNNYGIRCTVNILSLVSLSVDHIKWKVILKS